MTPDKPIVSDTVELRAYPDLLSEAERKQLLADAEWLWKRLEENDIGGFAGINRPFYILHAFKEVIEKFGRRDVGLSWSKNALDASHRASPTYGEPDGPSFTYDNATGKTSISEKWERDIEALAAPPAPVAQDGWINGEREIFLKWLPKLIAALGSKPDHVDDVMRLTRLHALLSASPVKQPLGEVTEEMVERAVDAWMGSNGRDVHAIMRHALVAALANPPEPTVEADKQKVRELVDVLKSVVDAATYQINFELNANVSSRLSGAILKANAILEGIG